MNHSFLLHDTDLLEILLIEVMEHSWILPLIFHLISYSSHLISFVASLLEISEVHKNDDYLATHHIFNTFMQNQSVSTSPELSWVVVASASLPLDSVQESETGYPVVVFAQYYSQHRIYSLQSHSFSTDIANTPLLLHLTFDPNYDDGLI